MNNAHTNGTLRVHTAAATGWPEPGFAPTPAVPKRYWGVWSRDLLETPEVHDTTTFVRWMQLGQWHVDLRVPASPDGALQGFCGITKVTTIVDREMCTWQRLVDYQPPRATVDEGWMVFPTSEQVLETGIHGVYFEEWNRLPGSVGRRIALAEAQRPDGSAGARILVSGEYLMRVRPVQPLGPEFEISFGRWVSGRWLIEASTLAGLSGTDVRLGLTRASESHAEVTLGTERAPWEVLEWFEP